MFPLSILHCFGNSKFHCIFLTYFMLSIFYLSFVFEYFLLCLHVPKMNQLALCATETHWIRLWICPQKENGGSLCMGMHNFNLILLVPMPAEVQVQQMLCDPRMHWSQAHLWSCLWQPVWLRLNLSHSTTVDKTFMLRNYFLDRHFA